MTAWEDLLASKVKTNRGCSRLTFECSLGLLQPFETRLRGCAGFLRGSWSSEDSKTTALLPHNHKASQVRVNQIQYSASHPLRRRRRKTITMTLPKTTMSNCRRRKCLSSDCRGCKTRESLDRPPWGFAGTIRQTLGSSKSSGRPLTPTVPWRASPAHRWNPFSSMDFRAWRKFPIGPIDNFYLCQAQLKHTHTHGSSLHPNGQEPTNGVSVRNVPDTLDISNTSDSGRRRGRDSFGCSRSTPPCWLASARLSFVTCSSNQGLNL